MYNDGPVNFFVYFSWFSSIFNRPLRIKVKGICSMPDSFVPINTCTYETSEFWLPYYGPYVYLSYLSEKLGKDLKTIKFFLSLLILIFYLNVNFRGSQI